MVAALPAIGAGLAGAGLVGSIINRRRTPQFDTAQLQSILNAGGEEQRRLLGQIRPETQTLTNQFRTDVTGAQDRARADQASSSARLLQELDPITSRLFQTQRDQLKRESFGAIPEATRAAREALAATGGLGRGIAAEELARIPVQAAQEFQRGVSGLTAQGLQTKQAALQNLQSQESQLIAQNLGIDQNTFNTILQTGNEALINELNGLIEESKRRTQGLSDIEQFRQTGNVAAASADEANRQAIFQALAGLGGTLAGQSLPQGIETVSPTRRRRATIEGLA